MEVRDLHHAYVRRAVLRGIDMDLRPGVLVGIVGENGAGKSTLLRILSGELRPQRGPVSHTGRFGYCPQEVVLNDALTVRQHLEFFKAAFGLADLRHAQEVMEALRLSEYADERAGVLSGGTRQKLNLTLALMHDPQVLLESAEEPDRQRLTAVFRGTIDPITAHHDVLDVMTRTGALIKAAQQAHSYAERARAELQGLAQAERLTELAESAAERRR